MLNSRFFSIFFISGLLVIVQVPVQAEAGLHPEAKAILEINKAKRSYLFNETESKVELANIKSDIQQMNQDVVSLVQWLRELSAAGSFADEANNAQLMQRKALIQDQVLVISQTIQNASLSEKDPDYKYKLLAQLSVVSTAVSDTDLESPAEQQDALLVSTTEMVGLVTEENAVAE